MVFNMIFKEVNGKYLGKSEDFIQELVRLFKLRKYHVDIRSVKHSYETGVPEKTRKKILLVAEKFTAKNWKSRIVFKANLTYDIEKNTLDIKGHLLGTVVKQKHVSAFPLLNLAERLKVLLNPGTIKEKESKTSTIMKEDLKTILRSIEKIILK